MSPTLSPDKSVLSWASTLEPQALEQALTTASMPFVVKPLALMPDAHLGKGCQALLETPPSRGGGRQGPGVLVPMGDAREGPGPATNREDLPPMSDDLIDTTEVPIAVRIATIQIALPYRGEDDGEQVSEVLGALVDTNDSEILDWRYLKVGAQYMLPTTSVGAVTLDGGHYIEGSAFRD